jgi:N-acyl-L-homoserine lactone synthetase
MPLKLFLARDEAERERIYRFRYRVYVEELDWHPPEADHDGKRVTDEFDPYSNSYGLIDDDGAVVGTLRASYMDRLPDPSPFIAKYEMGPAIDFAGRAAVSATGRFMIDPRLRHGQASAMLLRAAYEDARKNGIRLNFSDCSPYLIRFEERIGQRRYTAPFEDPDFGFKLRIMMVVGDREHFAAVRSPLAPLADAYSDDPAARAWFAATYPDWVWPQTAGFIPVDTFFDLLADHIAHDPTHTIGILRGLSREDAAQFLGASTVMTAGPGERIVREGERDPTVFVLLKGLAEVARGDGRAVATLGAGDIFGEISFLTQTPRMASVVARSPCELLTLSADFLRQFLDEHPAIAARVLFNLSRILAGRLAQTTVGLAASEPPPIAPDAARG